MTATAKKSTRRFKPESQFPPELVLLRLGIIGSQNIEPAILGALVGAEPLLLIGPHGTGKSYLLNRIAAALGLKWRHYNASLLNYDDLVGFPVPGQGGTLEYIQTPASIWGAEAVFIDEISRCRPDLQNKLFPIIHERRVQGILLDKLVYRWSAMNPPSGGDDDTGYSGSEPLDAALADRFAFVVEMPDWHDFGEQQQEELILATEDGVPEAASLRLRSMIASARSLLEPLRAELSARLAGYVRILAGLLLQAGTAISPRRAGMLLRNILNVHAARIAWNAVADPGESAWQALRCSLPHLATGEKIDRVKILAAHREAWKIAGMEIADPRRVILLERDPLVRGIRAAATEVLTPQELSTIVADSLASLPVGARHALAAAIFESGAADRLVAAIAEQCAALYALAATPQDVQEKIYGGGARYRCWKKLVSKLAGLDPKEADTPLTTNLFAGLYGAGTISCEDELASAWKAWHEARTKIRSIPCEVN